MKRKPPENKWNNKKQEKQKNHTIFNACYSVLVNHIHTLGVHTANSLIQFVNCVNGISQYNNFWSS